MLEKRLRLLKSIIRKVFGNIRYICTCDRYICNALNGNSAYNICINSDMTVSCNCQDWDGSGHIGDLSDSSFEDIFFGPVANKFRTDLAAGRFPIALCQSCTELKKVSKQEAQKNLERRELPLLGMMVENTVLCNYDCIGCNRKSLMKIRSNYTMSIEDTIKVAEILRRLQIESLCYFNLGEPFLDKDILPKLHIIRNTHPSLRITTSTNGSLLNSNNAVQAALLMDHIYVSIDGSDEKTMSEYQVGGSFKRSYSNLVNLVRARNAANKSKPLIEWKYVVFAWNDSKEHIERAVALAKDAGVDLISFWLGGASYEHTSKRFCSDPFFSQLGIASWKGREVYFRNEPSSQVCK